MTDLKPPLSLLSLSVSVVLYAVIVHVMHVHYTYDILH